MNRGQGGRGWPGFQRAPFNGKRPERRRAHRVADPRRAPGAGAHPKAARRARRHNADRAQQDRIRHGKPNPCPPRGDCRRPGHAARHTPRMRKAVTFWNTQYSSRRIRCILVNTMAIGHRCFRNRLAAPARRPLQNVKAFHAMRCQTTRLFPLLSPRERNTKNPRETRFCCLRAAGASQVRRRCHLSTPRCRPKCRCRRGRRWPADRGRTGTG